MEYLELQSFPVEVLSTLAGHLHGDDLTRLLFCGSKALNNRLTSAEGGITEFKVKIASRRHNRSFGILSCFPAIRSVQIETSDHRVPVSVNLRGIPASVTSLSLPRFDTRQSCDFASFVPNLLRLHVPVSLELPSLTLPHHLEHLHMGMHPRDFAKLPTSLISLHLEHHSPTTPEATDHEEDFWSSFGKLVQLERLTLAFEEIPNITRFLPQTLLVLDVCRSTFQDPRMILSSLPTSLVELSCGYKAADFPVPDFSILPRGLLILSLLSTSVSWSEDLQRSLPPNLTSLWEPRKGKTNNNHLFQHLPLSMKILTLSCPSSNFKFGYLQNLEELDLPDCTLDGTMGKIPRNLKSLNIHSVSSLRTDWPESLRNLSIRDVMPRFYEDLELQTIQPYLPRNLTFLGVPLTFWPPSFWSLMPRGMTSLSLVGSSEYDTFHLTEANASDLPPSLLTLSIIGSNIYHNDDFTMALCRRCPSLSSLQLEASGKGLTTKCFSHFPPSLEGIALYLSSSISNSDFSLLPTTLKTLLLSSSALHHPLLTSDFLSFLPPRITTIRIPIGRNQKPFQLLQNENSVLVMYSSPI